eukprot:SAG31_NODE_4559_length_3137_cov_8.827189_4_plen_144_part_00
MPRARSMMLPTSAAQPPPSAPATASTGNGDGDGYRNDAVSLRSAAMAVLAAQRLQTSSRSGLSPNPLPMLGGADDGHGSAMDTRAEPADADADGIAAEELLMEVRFSVLNLYEVRSPKQGCGRTVLRAKHDNVRTFCFVCLFV